MTATVLTDEQVESFVEHGYLTLHDCFTREAAQPWLDGGAACELLGGEDLISQCTSFVETTGGLGDVVLMLHAVSQNHRGTARFITNPPIALKEPMDFDRADPGEHSPVERAVLRALGVDRLDFRPTAAREDVVPERVRRQERMAAQEQERLAEASS
jgi:hypothetical protein